MRQFKFRAFHKAQKKMFEVFSFCDKFIKFINGDYTLKWNRDEFEPIMQFTGKLGFNKRELYEGDIVFYEEAEETGDRRYWLVIVWIEEWSMFASVFTDEYKKYLEKGAEVLDEGLFWTYTLQESEHFHYAGNIYQNPDLLNN